MNSGILSALQKFCIISKQAREAVMTRHGPGAYKLAPSLFKPKVCIYQYMEDIYINDFVMPLVRDGLKMRYLFYLCLEKCYKSNDPTIFAFKVLTKQEFVHILWSVFRL